MQAISSGCGNLATKPLNLVGAGLLISTSGYDTTNQSASIRLRHRRELNRL